MRRTAVINVVGLTERHIGDDTPHISALLQHYQCRRIRPAFPAVTCTAQSDYLTGVRPDTHGVVGNGWYDRGYSDVCFWKQSNRLVTAPKIWDTLRERHADFSCAKLFWWYNMYAAVDYSITPRPMYPADGRKVFDIHTSPHAIRHEIKRDIGNFPFQAFWGPGAGIASSRWIAAAARWVEAHHQPTLNLIYLPHLDYNLQRLGPDHADIRNDLIEIDGVVGDLITYFGERSVEVVVLSEYGILAIDRPIHLNRLFRQQGWVAIKEELGLDMIDTGASSAFAVADHQIAHVYVNDPSIISVVRRLLEHTEGVAEVLDEAGRAGAGINHPRSGDLVVVADSRSWFTYYYWLDDRLAPDFARCVDIHRKIGYDPAELFIDPMLSMPQLRVFAFLLKKRLGMRALLDIIPLDAGLVRGSHGRCPDDPADYPVLITPARDGRSGNTDDILASTDVYHELMAVIEAE